MLDESAYGAVVFDLDGTLVDTLPDLHDALLRALTDLDLPPVPLHVVRSSLHGGLEASTIAALDWLVADSDRYEPLLHAYRSHCITQKHRNACSFDGVPEMLERLKASGMALGVCTNKTGDAALALLQQLGLAPYCDAVVGADSCARRKPDPMPLWFAIDRLDVPRKRVLYVGDSVVDFECAKAADVDFRLYAGGYGAEEVLRDNAVSVLTCYRKALSTLPGLHRTGTDLSTNAVDSYGDEPLAAPPNA